MKRTLGLVLALAGMIALTNAAYSQQLYGLSSSSPGILYRLDAATGAASNPVTLTNTVETSFVGLAFLNGTLYASDVYAGGFELRFGTIDPTTGAFTAINDQGGSVNWQAITPNTRANLLYVADLHNDFGKPQTNTLDTVTPTGAITVIAQTDHHFTGLAYDNAAGILYGIDISDNLYTINTATGASTFIGSTGLSSPYYSAVYLDLAMDANGTLFLNEGEGHKLYTVNTSTAALTLVGYNGNTLVIDGLAFASATSPVPEPGFVSLSMSSLLALGGGGLLLRRRKPARKTASIPSCTRRPHGI